MTAPPAEWLLNQQDGFTWWPGPLPQRVWTEEGIFRNSRTYYRVHAEVDLLKGRNQRAVLDPFLEKSMDDCAMSCLLYDERTDTYRLHASVYAESEIAHWVCKVFQAAAQLQLQYAYGIVKSACDDLGATPAQSEHPISGLRQDRDPRITGFASPFVTQGAEPSRWADKDEWRLVNWAVERQCNAYQKSDGRSSHSNYYWSADCDHTMDLLISCEEPHPTLGNGLHFTLSIPLRMSAKHIAYMALELNMYEKENWLKTHMLGSWCNHEDRLAFRLFVPNALYQEGVLQDLTVTMASRAAWTDEFFLAKKRAAEKAKQMDA
ncbi:MAG TPA: hypothetical protein VNI20_08365 [Fimbriimonadaceae bacterium]|nr:hypothetical protein [Fimbriimonadaceae bacterium]